MSVFTPEQESFLRRLMAEKLADEEWPSGPPPCGNLYHGTTYWCSRQCKEDGKHPARVPVGEPEMDLLSSWNE